jgi:outer membrane scaffolding protein for murein synthesis (MipA/OmpV family)
MYIMSRNWSILGIARLDWLDDSWTDSSIVADDNRLTSFVGLNYTF